MGGVSRETIDGLLAASTFMVTKVGSKTCLVVCTLPSGFEITATSACDDPKDYDEDVGLGICKKKIADKVWELEGYRSQCDEKSACSCRPVAYSGSDFSFSYALSVLKRGGSVCRKGWNGKGMFVYMVPANAYEPTTEAAKLHYGGSKVPYNAYLAIKNVNETVSTWVPSINDVLADDWVIYSA